jgi:hypothetical protein
MVSYIRPHIFHVLIYLIIEEEYRSIYVQHIYHFPIYGENSYAVCHDNHSIWIFNTNKNIDI